MRKYKIFSCIVITILGGLLFLPLGPRFFYAILFLLIAFTIISFFQLTKFTQSPINGYKNPYVDTNLYKLPLTEKSKLPPVNYPAFKPQNDETLYFATETSQKNNEGVFLITSQRCINKNITQNYEISLKDIKGVKEVSNSAIMIETDKEKNYILLNSTQVKITTEVLNWARRGILQ